MGTCKVIRLLILSQCVIIKGICGQASEGNTKCCQISPLIQALNITNGSEPSILTCTTTCQNFELVYFSNQDGHDIHDNLRPFLGDPSSSHNGENGTYSINIPWTMNDQIRNALSSVYCKVVHRDAHDKVSSCRTGNVNINFIDEPATSSAPTTVTSAKLPTTSTLTTTDSDNTTTPATMGTSDPETTTNNSRSQVKSQFLYSVLLTLLTLNFMFVCYL